MSREEASQLAARLGLELIHAFHYQNRLLVAGAINEAGIRAQGGSDVTGIGRGVAVRGGADLRPWGHLAQPYGSNLASVVQGASGVRVGIVDSGVDCWHLDFIQDGSKACIAGRSYSFVEGEPDPYQDPDGHGTAVASVALARATGTHLRGAAPDAWLNVYKVISASGYSNCTWIAAAVDQATYDLIDVINVSMQVHDNDSTRVLCASLESAITFATGAGLFVVGIAGNVEHVGPNVGLPGAYADVLTVSGLRCGANTSQNCSYPAIFWEGSASGPEVDLAAAAAFVAVSTPTTTSRLFGSTGGDLRFADGTSYAAPLVSGVAAMIIARYPSARRQAQAVAAHLKATAYAPSSGADPLRYGAGILNASAALASDPCLTQHCYLHPDP